MGSVHPSPTLLLIALLASTMPHPATGQEVPSYPLDLSSPAAQPQASAMGLDGGPLGLGELRFSLQVFGSHLPLQYRAAHLTQLRIDHAVGGAVGAAVGFSVADLGVTLPVAMNVAGQVEGHSWRASSVGDLVIVPRVSPLPPGTGPLGVILAVPVTLPTGNPDSFAGHLGLTAEPQLQLSLHVGRLAVVVRPGVRVQGGHKLTIPYFSDWLTLHAAVGIGVGPRRQVRPEIGLRGVAPVQGAGGAAGELLGGLAVEPVEGLVFTAHAGAGIGEMPGVAAVRVLGSVSWRGGGSHTTTAGRDDRDRDGLSDRLDRCPGAAEDVDGHEDDDGCPDPDNDGDGNPDGSDACPDLPGFGTVGCPPGTVGEDLDRDSVVEGDACPLRPEDTDGFEDEDGCPEPDNDGDRILDEADGCPDEAEDGKGPEPRDGCPRR